MDRLIDTTLIAGEIGLEIDYQPGQSPALEVLHGAMALIAALDGLDHCLLAAIDTALEPVSILNDVQHASLKILLARALRQVPDAALATLDWKPWIGGLLIKGKYLLLSRLHADAPEIERALQALAPDYLAAPAATAGYAPPRVAEAQQALAAVVQARDRLGEQRVLVQTELGDILLTASPDPRASDPAPAPRVEVVNQGREFFKVKTVDMLGQARWTLMRAGRAVPATILNRDWLAAYHQRRIPLLPGDSLECRYEETVVYDGHQNEIERRLAIIEVVRVIAPPQQQTLF
jgi:hypothetical protein